MSRLVPPDNGSYKSLSKMKRTRSISRGRSLKRTKTFRPLRDTPANVVSTSTSVVPRGLLAKALPKYMDVTLRYFESITIDAAGGAAASHLFRANSLYDPNFTSTGHQPLGFDQWMSLYSKGVVLNSKIVVKALAPPSANVDIGVFGCALRGTNTSVIVTSELIEADRSSFACYARDVDLNQECSTQYSAKEFYSVKDPVDEDDLAFTAGADSAKQAYYHVFQGSINSTVNPIAVICQVLIEYKVRLYEPQPLASS